MEYLEVKFIWEDIQREASENFARTEGLPYIKRDGEIKKIYYRKSVTNNKIKYDSFCEIDNELVKYDSRTGITEYGDQIYITLCKGAKVKFVQHLSFIWFYSDNIVEENWDNIERMIIENYDDECLLSDFSRIKPHTYYYYNFDSNDFDEFNKPDNLSLSRIGIEIKI